MGFSRLDVDINLIAASEAVGGRGEAFWSSRSLKRATCPSRVCLRTSMYVKHPVARGSSLTRAPGPPVLAPGYLGSYCTPGILVKACPMAASCTQVP